MPLPITFKELGVPALMPKPFVVLWDHPESSFTTCLPKEQISEAVQIYHSYYKKKRNPEAQLFPE